MTSPDDAPTRSRVTQVILENGPASAAELAERLELTPAAVRRHLDHLLADGTVEARDRRQVGQRGRGRPAKVFAITAQGRDQFTHSYDELAASALRFLSESGGEAAVKQFARHRLADLETRYSEALDGVPTAQRPRALADALSADGFAASTSSTPAGTQMCQHHCPVSHVAAEFPQMCEAEAEMFSRLLGTHVQRLATIAHGDGVCTTHLPAAPAAGHSPTPTTERATS